jgi:CheY-like chemotaxis protein
MNQKTVPVAPGTNRALAPSGLSFRTTSSIRREAEGPRGIAPMVDGVAPSRLELPSPEPHEVEVAATRRLRVLIIEDHPDAADSLALLLELLGHEPRVARDGQQGVEAAREFHPDVILCDIGLPVMDGYQVARRLRGQPEVAPRLLVALTGYSQEEDCRRAFAAGFDRHYTKPADPDEIISLLDHVRKEMGTPD